MKVHYSLDKSIDIERSVVTTGTFDGVHIGHQVIIGRINELAKEINGDSVLITFHPHPRKILYPDTIGKEIKMINTQREKITILKTTGLDHLVIIPFSKEFASTSSESFVRNILIEKLKIKKSVVGFNHFFGYNKEGNYEQLVRLGLELGFTVEEIPEQDIQNETVSSTIIRKAITDGYIQRANAYLNHILMMMGNILPVEYPHEAIRQCNNVMIVYAEEEEKLLPPHGCYAIRVKQNQVNAKCIGIRNEELHDKNAMLIIPVEPAEILNELATINFYKQLVPGKLNSPEQIPAIAALAEELIY